MKPKYKCAATMSFAILRLLRRNQSILKSDIEKFIRENSHYKDCSYIIRLVLNSGFVKQMIFNNEKYFEYTATN